MIAPEDPRTILVFVDADACPVKNEIYRVAGRHGIKTYVVSNSFFQVPRDPLIERVVVAEGMDKADDWIAERARPGRGRRHRRHPAGRPLREGRRHRAVPEWPRL